MDMLMFDLRGDQLEMIRCFWTISFILCIYCHLGCPAKFIFDLEFSLSLNMCLRNCFYMTVSIYYCLWVACSFFYLFLFYLASIYAIFYFFYDFCLYCAFYLYFSLYFYFYFYFICLLSFTIFSIFCFSVVSCVNLFYN